MAIVVAVESLAVNACSIKRVQAPSAPATGRKMSAVNPSSRTCCLSARNNRVASATSARQHLGYATTGGRVSRVCSAAASESAPVMATTGVLNYQHLMLALADPSPYFGDGSKQAIVTTGMLATLHESKVTVLMLDEKAMDTEDNVRRMDILTTSLKEQGCSNFEVVDQVGAPSCSAAIGDVADDVEASLLIMSTEAIHTKRVDSNLLAEFVPCPMLMLP